MWPSGVDRAVLLGPDPELAAPRSQCCPFRRKQSPTVKLERRKTPIALSGPSTLHSLATPLMLPVISSMAFFNRSILQNGISYY